jgi:hypothetical protein
MQSGRTAGEWAGTLYKILLGFFIIVRHKEKLKEIVDKHGKWLKGDMYADRIKSYNQ